jgi:hypothetical protein
VLECFCLLLHPCSPCFVLIFSFVPSASFVAMSTLPCSICFYCNGFIHILVIHLLQHFLSHHVLLQYFHLQHLHFNLFFVWNFEKNVKNKNEYYVTLSFFGGGGGGITRFRNFWWSHFHFGFSSIVIFV